MNRRLVVKISGENTSEIFNLLDILVSDYRISKVCRLKNGTDEERHAFVNLERKLELEVKKIEH